MSKIGQSVSWGKIKLYKGEVFRFIFVPRYGKCTKVQLYAQSCLLMFSK